MHSCMLLKVVMNKQSILGITRAACAAHLVNLTKRELNPFYLTFCIVLGTIDEFALKETLDLNGMEPEPHAAKVARASRVTIKVLVLINEDAPAQRFRTSGRPASFAEPL